MKNKSPSRVVSCLITLCFISSYHHTTATSRSSTWSSTHDSNQQPSPINAPSYQALCEKTYQPELCSSTIESDHRESLKSDPRGFVVILADAARSTSNKTSSYIRKALEDSKDKRTRVVLQECLRANNFPRVINSLTLDVKDIDREHYSDIDMGLNEAGDEVSYDCEWTIPEDPSPLLKKMVDMVDTFSNIVNVANQILSLVICGNAEPCDV